MTRIKKKGRRGGGGGRPSEPRIINRDGRVNRPSMPDKEGDWMTDWSNIKFERYYEAQGILDSSEWQLLMDAMRKTLPTTFRLLAGKQTTSAIADIIRTVHIPHLSGITFEGELLQPPKVIPWYPNGLAYEVNASKRVVRKSPEFKELHRFLVYQTEVGNISRQEAVSMIPPLLLDVQSHHIVLDTCASPGSKTAQLVEALHTSSENKFTTYPSGLVIANDADFTRAQLLVHQSARLPSPALMITNLDASIYPTMKLNDGSPMLFDRILCDVPCSGDGTMRKNVGIWKSWTVGSGNGLHSLQLRILQRAMQMLKPGGKIVYSTCSMNPVENEAVVAAAMNSNPGQYVLPSTKSMLPGLIRHAGLTRWSPEVATNLDKSTPSEADAGEGAHTTSRDPTRFFTSYEAYLEAIGPVDRKADKARAYPSMWAPENASELGLENCIRIYPHLQNTGAFFVAVIQKLEVNARSAARTSPAKSDSLPIAAKRTASHAEILQPPSVKRTKTTEETPSAMLKPPEQDQSTFKEQPFTFISESDAVLQSNINRLHLVNNFPAANVFVRHHPSNPMKTFYLGNDKVKEIILNNPHEKIRLLSAGVKVLARHDLGPLGSNPEGDVAGDEDLGTLTPHTIPITIPKDRNYALRFVNEGIVVMNDFAGDAVKIGLQLEDLKVLLSEYFPLIINFRPEFADIINAKVSGSYIVVVEPAHSDAVSLSHTMILPLWKSTTSLSLMVDKQAKLAISMHLWGKDLTQLVKPAEDIVD